MTEEDQWLIKSYEAEINRMQRIFNELIFIMSQELDKETFDRVKKDRPSSSMMNLAIIVSQ